MSATPVFSQCRGYAPCPGCDSAGCARARFAVTPPADLPPLPEGCHLLKEGASPMIVMTPNGSSVSWWSDGTVTMGHADPVCGPEVDASDLLAVLAHLKARAERGET